MEFPVNAFLIHPTWEQLIIIVKSLKYNQITELRSGYSLSFDIDYIDKKLYLCVYDFDKNLIEREAFVYLDTTKEQEDDLSILLIISLLL